GVKVFASSLTRYGCKFDTGLDGVQRRACGSRRAVRVLWCFPWRA
ncbi:unnamed protein product, partial [Amoebophrya sp. A120]